MTDKLAWQDVCIVGYGGHAKEKLVPALKRVGLKVSTVVSRNASAEYDFLTVYSTINEAVEALNKNTLFVISSPPDIHYSQVKKALNSGFNVFVEKPGFLLRNNAEELSLIANNKKLILLEMFMFYENHYVKKLKKKLEENRKIVKSISFDFRIPAVPLNSYRTKNDLPRALLADMVCYPLSFLIRSGFDANRLCLSRVEGSQLERPQFRLEGESYSASINIIVGLSEEYNNTCTVEFHNGSWYAVEPFFYGRAGQRSWTTFDGENTFEKSLNESSAFEMMFTREPQSLLLNQNERLRETIEIATLLEQFDKELLQIQKR